MNSNSDFLKVRHLYNRMSFGYSLSDTDSVTFKSALKSISATVDHLEHIKVTETGKMDREQLKAMSPDERKQFRKGKQEEFRTLNGAWIKQMCNGKDLLREKMAFFWHGHFACRNGIPVLMEDHVNVLREHALDDFKTLLTEVTKSAAMLQFLNNQQNRKMSPNENFARELMELFTLGRGNYTEKDVKEAARAFTGWGFNEDGEYEFRERQHDFGEKTFLGKTGNWNGDDIITIIIGQKQCAKFICKKIWRAFISDEEDDTAINILAEKYYQSGYNTSLLIQDIITSDWFYEEKYMGARIKSPIELLVPLIRDFKLEFVNDAFLFNIQRILGQVILYPPNVAGWPGGENWIDSSSLIYRMKLPRILLANAVSDVAPKDDGDVNGFEKMEKLTGKTERVRTNASWKDIYSSLENKNDTDLLLSVWMQLIAIPSMQPDQELLKKYSAVSGKEEQIKAIVLHIMTLPEYQLC
ncbi:MAG: DUF1800 domain-containing protein [Bacteroidota bacterium]